MSNIELEAVMYECDENGGAQKDKPILANLTINFNHVNEIWKDITDDNYTFIAVVYNDGRRAIKVNYKYDELKAKLRQVGVNIISIVEHEND